MERKQFLKTACAMCGVAVAGNFLTGCEKDSTAAPTVNFTVDLSSSTYATLATVGGAMLINGVFVINKDGANFTAVSSVCTHEGATIHYIDYSSGFVCPRHGATFATSGTVTGGPAQSNLKTYSVTRSGNILTIAG